MWLSDQTITAIIAEYGASGRSLSVRKLRRLMLDRHGCACGTDRLRRLLAPGAMAESAPSQVEELMAQLAEERRKRKLAEDREQVHQDRWANEIHDLRQQVTTLLRERRTQRSDIDRNLELHRELQLARVRITALESELITAAKEGRAPVLPAET